jgi:hypothetical protein
MIQNPTDCFQAIDLLAPARLTLTGLPTATTIGGCRVVACVTVQRTRASGDAEANLPKPFPRLCVLFILFILSMNSGVREMIF